MKYSEAKKILSENKESICIHSETKYDTIRKVIYCEDWSVHTTKDKKCAECFNKNFCGIFPSRLNEKG